MQRNDLFEKVRGERKVFYRRFSLELSLGERVYQREAFSRPWEIFSSPCSIGYWAAALRMSVTCDMAEVGEGGVIDCSFLIGFWVRMPLGRNIAVPYYIQQE